MFAHLSPLSILLGPALVVVLLAAVIASLLFAFRQKQRFTDLQRRWVATRESFVTDVTHEFRTPLTALLDIGRELKSLNAPHSISTSLTPEELATFNYIHEAGEAIECQGTHLLNLVNQLKDISNGKIEVRGQVGEESAFTVTLPYIKVHTQQQPHPLTSQTDSTPLPHREGQGGGSAGPVSVESEPAGSSPCIEQSDQFIDHVHGAILRLMPQGNMDVDSIAAELCLSPSQLRRKMNAVTGMPPKKFIMKVRMDAASEMMQQHPDMKLSDIAEKCGFYDLSHFIRLYKETHGTTPSADHRK